MVPPKAKSALRKGHWLSPSDHTSANPAHHEHDFRKDQQLYQHGQAPTSLLSLLIYSGQGEYRSEHCHFRSSTDRMQMTCFEHDSRT